MMMMMMMMMMMLMMMVMMMMMDRVDHKASLLAPLLALVHQ
jgi:hypothetical protein